MTDLKLQPNIHIKALPYEQRRITINDCGVDFSDTVAITIEAQHHSYVELNIMITQQQLATFSITMDVHGDHAVVDVVILYALSGTQRSILKTIQKHTGKHTKSSVVARGILKDQSFVDYQGMITLLEGSIKADASQEHTTIVMGNQAKVVSIPSIEVLHHDVRCCHGAAIGQFQQQHIWYLESRGFEKTKQHEMLVTSFFEQYCNRFEHSSNLLERLCQKII
ncbi:SufD family Fe-S cluster assembly protein [Candidatus Babeliales bacterium]|nr:SufD family Fe-S cluster assembly protein [Candidatus Babeliales bacterium]